MVQIINNDQKYKKYWDLLKKGEAIDKYVDELIKQYKKESKSDNKCTIAILLSHIDNDKRIPLILFDALNYWNDSDYHGWVMTSNARLFNYYPDSRKEYIDLAYYGKIFQRDILINSLFFIQEPLRNIDHKQLDKIISDYLKVEREDKLIKSVQNKMELKKNMGPLYQDRK